jgi:hypothetical protein
LKRVSEPQRKENPRKGGWDVCCVICVVV